MMNFMALRVFVRRMGVKNDATHLIHRNAQSLRFRATSINGVSFVMKNDPSRRKEIGVIAQDVEPVFPELVYTAKDEMKSKTVNYIGFIGWIIDAIKELRDELIGTAAELRDENQKLKEENDRLKTQMSDLDARLRRIEQLSDSARSPSSERK